VLSYTGYMMICWDLRRDKQSFAEEYGTLELKLNFGIGLPENIKLVIYTVNAKQFFVLDENGNYVPKLDKISL
jgi:hypothetical protein